MGKGYYIIIMAIDDIKQEANPVFQKYGVKSASVFGSFARGEENDSSDIDLMVEPSDTMDLVEYSAMREDLSARLNRNVDMVTSRSVNARLLPLIMQDMKKIYG